jgi:hypothetical protein
MRKDAGRASFFIAAAFLFAAFLGGSVSAAVPADQHPYWIFFRLPAGGADGRIRTRAALSVAPQAIARMERVGRTAGTSTADYPLDPRLLDPLRERGLEGRIRHMSRYLQAASALLTGEEARAVASDPRVRGVRPVARFVRPAPDSLEAAVESATPRGATPSPLPTPPDRDPRTLTASDYGSAWDQLEMLGIPDLHHKGLSGAGVTIAILDTGFLKDHESLAGLDLIAENDFVRGDDDVQYEPGDPGDVRRSNDHGTYTWSTLGGYAPGTLMGAAYRASFILAKTEDVTREVQAEEDNYIAGLEWAEGLGADLVSSSLGYLTFDDDTGYSIAQLDGETAPITVATDSAAARGVLVVTAMGNEGPAPSTLIAPADGKHVLSIGALDLLGNVATFSSRGPTGDGRTKPDVSAMGVSVFCATAANPAGYGSASGTSLSTPLIAGLAALMIEARPGWPPDTLAAQMRRAGSRAASPDNNIGWGIPDPLRAIRMPGPFVRIGVIDWTEISGGIADGIPGRGETGDLRIWIHNLGDSASAAGIVRILSHSAAFSLADSSAAFLGALAPGDSVLIKIARGTIDEGESPALLPIRIQVGHSPDLFDRRVWLPALPAYAVLGSVTSDGFGSIRVSWTTSGAAVSGVRIYRSSDADTVRHLVHEAGHGETVWADRVNHPGTFSYWFAPVLMGMVEGRSDGPRQVVLAPHAETRLGAPYPNPVSAGILTIPISWVGAEPPRVDIYDPAGRKVRTLLPTQNGGDFPRIEWDLKAESGRPVPSGLYVARATNNATIRLLVVR